ncbi:MAG: prohibitin family protein [Candidatus Magasanikbacteria bacterium]|nr:prohibitin family protein [Candidatus Magasanikbacteria bacterium]MBT4071150.1 prohibitin family protein [Candidatus Magasanikbacteria bacterium]
MEKIDPRKYGKQAGFLVPVIIVFILVMFGSSFWVIVDAGETGVPSLFGKVKNDELSSGFHVKNPFVKVTKMNIRTQEYTMSVTQGEGKRVGNDTIAALTKEGLSVDLDVTVLYHLIEEKASDVYKNVNVDYEEVIIRPQIRTAIREVVAEYSAKDIYSQKRQEVSEKILQSLKDTVEVRGILVEEVLLRNVVLPANLANSIQEKLQAEQEAQRYDFLLEKEKKEAERKRLEAEGQRDAQQIINQSLTPRYLEYLYINSLKDREGTIYVPTSPNSGMPLFRGI